MSAPGRTIRLTIELTYDAESMHGDDPDARKWFKDMLHGDDLQLSDFGELGDMIGKVRVVPDLCDPTQDERVKALEAENARLREVLDFADHMHRTVKNSQDHGNTTFSSIRASINAYENVRARAALRALEQR